jgi:hypothetical protein
MKSMIIIEACQSTRQQVVNETRHVWRVCLEQVYLNLAMRHLEEQQAAMDLILTKQTE